MLNRRVWTRQPQGVVPADPFWLSNGLVALVNGATNADHVSGRLCTIVGSGTTVNSDGVSPAFAGASYLSTPVTGVSGVAHTMIAVQYVSSYSSNRIICGLGDSGTSTNVSEIYVSTFGFLNYLDIASGSVAQVLGATSVAVNTRYVFAVVSRQTTLRETYRNGVFESSINTSLAFPTNLNTFNVGVERYNGSLAGYFVGSIPIAAVFNRALTAAEIASISANPWQLFAPLSRPVFAPSAAVVGGWKGAWGSKQTRNIGTGVK